MVRNVYYVYLITLIRRGRGEVEGQKGKVKFSPNSSSTLLFNPILFAVNHFYQTKL